MIFLLKVPKFHWDDRFWRQLKDKKKRYIISIWWYSLESVGRTVFFLGWLWIWKLESFFKALSLKLNQIRIYELSQILELLAVTRAVFVKLYTCIADNCYGGLCIPLCDSTLNKLWAIAEILGTSKLDIICIFFIWHWLFVFSLGDILYDLLPFSFIISNFRELFV